jgi:hypothetical protein
VSLAHHAGEVERTLDAAVTALRRFMDE